MTPELKRVLKFHKAATFQELAKESRVSINKIKNISCGRTSFATFFKKRSQYRVFPSYSKELAELIGIVLGDGNIYQFDRCQRLTISCNSSYEQYIKHIACLVKKVFKKEPRVVKRSKVNCTDVRLYLQDIDKALNLLSGNKQKNLPRIPDWIFRNKMYLMKCLKGLFETDGHYGISKKFYVEYIQLCSKPRSLRESVFKALTYLGYSVQFGNNYVRLAKKEQVRRFIKSMDFVRPFPSLGN